MDAQTFFLIAGTGVICLMGGMTLYPLLQAFGIIECNCDKFDEEQLQIANGQTNQTANP